MKAGFGFYNYSSFNPYLPDFPWSVDTRQGIVVVPALAQGKLVGTGRSVVSHLTHHWIIDIDAMLIDTWTQYKVSYIEEPLNL